MRDTVAPTSSWLFKCGRSWFRFLPGETGAYQKVSRLDPAQVCGSWVSLVNSGGQRIFSFLLPKPGNRDDALVICERLNAASSSNSFVIELIGAPEGSRASDMFPGWRVALLVQIAILALVCAAYAIAGRQCAGSGCVTSSGASVPVLWIYLGALLPFVSWVTVTPVSLAFGDDLYSGGWSNATKGLALRIPVTLLLGAMLALIVTSGPNSPETSLPVTFLITLHVFMALVLVHGIAKATSGGDRGSVALITAWCLYGASLAVAPELWFLPPLMACLLPLTGLLRDLISCARGSQARQDFQENEDRLAIFKAGSIFSAVATGALFWGDKVLMIHLFPEQGPAGPGAVMFMAAAIPAVVICAWYFSRPGPSLSRLWNVTAEVMCQSSIPVFNASRALMIPVFDLAVAEMSIVLQAGWMVALVFFDMAYPGGLARFHFMIYSSGLLAFSFVLSVWLMAMKSWLPVIMALVSISVCLVSGFWLHRHAYIEMTFESLSLVFLVSAATIAPMLVFFARRVASLPQYPVFWWRVANW